MTLLTTVLSSLLFLGCNDHELLPANPVTFLPIMVDGDTVKPSHLPDFALEKVLKNNQNYSIVVENTTIGGKNIVLPALNGSAPDLSNIKNLTIIL